MHRPRERFAIRIFAKDLQHRHFRQFTRRDVTALASALQRSFVGELRQDLFQNLPVRAFHAKCPHQIAFCIAGMRGKVLQHHFARQFGTLFSFQFFRHCAS